MTNQHSIDAAAEPNHPLFNTLAAATQSDLAGAATTYQSFLDATAMANQPLFNTMAAATQSDLLLPQPAIFSHRCGCVGMIEMHEYNIWVCLVLV